MNNKQIIYDFLQQENIAVAGVSRKKDIPANHIFTKFKKAGYRTFAINPNADMIDGEKCWPDIFSLPEKPGAVMLAGTPEVSEKIMTDCIKAGVLYVWMHKGIGTGSYSESAERIGMENDIHVVSNGCPMMFIKPADPFHRILRWFKKL